MPGKIVRMPGDRAEEQRQQYRTQGIPLDRDLYNQLNSLAVACGAPALVPSQRE